MKFYMLGFATILYLLTMPAYAYIDPGMGSMWIQSCMAIIAGLSVSAKMYWQRIKLFFISKMNTTKTETNDSIDSNRQE